MAMELGWRSGSGHGGDGRNGPRRWWVREAIGVAVVAGMIVGSLFPAGAHPGWFTDGRLDSTFGRGGLVTTDLGGDVDWGETVQAVAVQPDGRIVAAGPLLRTVDGIQTMEWALVRYRRDGRLDGSFGDRGQVRTSFGGGWDFLSALVVQPDGKVVAAGFAGTAGGADGNIALARYDHDGRLDPTFGTGGRVVTDLAAWESAYALDITPDGHLLTAGLRDDGSTQDFVVARFDRDGRLDPSFGDGGSTTTDFAGRFDFADAVVALPDGRVVVAGASDDGTSLDFALARYQADGRLDPTFGAGGLTTTDFAGDADHINDIALQTDGRLVAAGYTLTGGELEVALARYDQAGSLDRRFGTGGRTVTDLGDGSAQIRSLAIQADGKLVGAGEADAPDGTGAFALLRYRPDGRLDRHFGDGGHVLSDFGGSAGAAALAIQADGRLNVAGSVFAPGTAQGDFALARYQVRSHYHEATGDPHS